MFSFHWPEVIVLLGLALLIFGPKRLPEIGGSLGRGIKEFRKATTHDEDKPELAAPQSSDVRIPDPTVHSTTVERPVEASTADKTQPTAS